MYSKLDRFYNNLFLGDTTISSYLASRLLEYESNSTKYSASHVFVTGLARSGSTALLNNLFRDTNYASILYKHMPLVLSPKLAVLNSQLTKSEDSNRERFHGDGISINLNSPECLDEVFWLKTLPNQFESNGIKFISINRDLSMHILLI